MPYSSVVFDMLSINIINALRPKSILDIGAGSGKYGRLIRLLQQNDPSYELETLACVEVDRTYIDSFGLEKIYDRVIQEDIRSWENLIEMQGDLAIVGDVIEHLPKSAGEDLIDFLTYNFKHTLVITPIDMAQGAWQGRDQERHISRW
ncbi:MAG: hypothetical protein FJY58_10690, partial [Betaproteobacteria bacterium]|nr:hypothetical protein [Betaproteobacteria bacterium]